MPILSKPRPLAPEEDVDLTRMQHLGAHPALAPLLAQKTTLRQQLSMIEDEVRGLHQQLHDLSSDDTFTAAATRRTLQDRLSEREREGATLEEQLQHLGNEIACVEAPLREQARLQRTHKLC
jgi:predicted  nucleic acid-binding Zn-ribbon protein